eukprot:18799-Heterococcus_DN1.PRE.4
MATVIQWFGNAAAVIVYYYYALVVELNEMFSVTKLVVLYKRTARRLHNANATAAKRLQATIHVQQCGSTIVLRDT